jgi:hypothetical protein
MENSINILCEIDFVLSANYKLAGDTAIDERNIPA